MYKRTRQKVLIVSRVMMVGMMKSAGRKAIFDAAKMVVPVAANAMKIRLGAME